MNRLSLPTVLGVTLLLGLATVERWTFFNLEKPTKQVMEYPVPRSYTQPYAVAVDRNHNVWISTFTDVVLRFDPSTKTYGVSAAHAGNGGEISLLNLTATVTLGG